MTRRALFVAALLAGVAALSAAPATAQTTLRNVMHSDLKILDPIWTTAYIVRNHGYMIYDTLFGMDEKGEIKPQMVELSVPPLKKAPHRPGAAASPACWRPAS